MSIEHAHKTHTIATEIGIVVVSETLVSDYDIEDIISDRAVSQARAMQMLNLSKELDGNIQPQQGVVPSKLRPGI